MKKLFTCLTGVLALCCLYINPLSAQDNEVLIKGVVVDQSGEAVIGATVLEKNSQNGIVVDLDGKFELYVSKNPTIIVSALGYADYSFQPNGKTSFKIVLKEDNLLLEETVVTAFATQKKINVTGAITAVTGDDVLQAPVANISSALVGITPGLSSVTVSGECM